MVISLDLMEWSKAHPDEYPELKGQYLNTDSAHNLAELLQNAIRITELKEGLSVETTSYVGRLRVGDIQITVRPKIKMSSLLNLLRYAYGLRDIKIVSEADQQIEELAFQDLLIHQLLIEISEFMSRGLRREYVGQYELLSSPHGRIDMQAIARQGGMIDATLPCHHYPRLEDTLLNRVLLAGLYFASRLTQDMKLRTRARRLAKLFEESVQHIKLSAALLDTVYRQLNRITKPYESAVAIIEMLFFGQGISIDSDTEYSLPGFLFDMNRFWEALLSRLLRENLPDFVVRDQHRLSEMMRYVPAYNPQRRKSPTPRPDYVILKDNQIKSMLDAKYRDIWNKGLPRDMLYQLGIYALSQGSQGKATILYPVIEPNAQPELIEISNALSSSSQALVRLQPINLYQLEELILGVGRNVEIERKGFVERIVFGNSPI